MGMAARYMMIAEVPLDPIILGRRRNPLAEHISLVSQPRQPFLEDSKSSNQVFVITGAAGSQSYTRKNEYTIAIKQYGFDLLSHFRILTTTTVLVVALVASS